MFLGGEDAPARGVEESVGGSISLHYQYLEETQMRSIVNTLVYLGEECQQFGCICDQIQLLLQDPDTKCWDTAHELERLVLYQSLHLQNNDKSKSDFR